MNAFLHRLRRFAADPARRRASYLAALLLIALADYAVGSRTARSFGFLSLRDGKPVVERRFVPRSFSREKALGRYVSEYLLGPTGVESAYLFSRGTALRSALVRNGVAYVDLTGDAAFPPEEGLDARDSVNILKEGIERNFPSIQRAMVFIEGQEPTPAPFSDAARPEAVPKKGKSVDK